MNLIHRIPPLIHRIRNSKKPHISRVPQHLVQRLAFPPSHHLEPTPPWIHHPNRLLQALLPRPSDRHHLADTLHRRADLAADVRELGQVPLGDLGDDVVQGRFEACGCGLRDGVRKRGQGVAESDLRGGVGKGVTGSLGRQST